QFEIFKWLFQRCKYIAGILLNKPCECHYAECCQLQSWETKGVHSYGDRQPGSQAAFVHKTTPEVQESPAWTLKGQQRGERSLWDCKGAGNSDGTRVLLFPLSEPDAWTVINTFVLSSAIFV
ncbi:hypothetical protein HGM15179_006822, partial [Zosterops borbonicus]